MQQFQKQNSQNTDKDCCKYSIRAYFVLVVYTYPPCCKIGHRLLSCDINGSPSHISLISPTVGFTFYAQAILLFLFYYFVFAKIPGQRFCSDEDATKSPKFCEEGTKVTPTVRFECKGCSDRSIFATPYPCLGSAYFIVYASFIYFCQSNYRSDCSSAMYSIC